MTTARRGEVSGPVLAVGALVVAGIALGVIAFGNLGQNLVYYWSPSEMLAQGPRAYGPTIRLGGVVAPGSVEWNSEHTSLTFRVSDDGKEGSAEVKVACDQVPPQMFREKIGVVVEGTFDGSRVFKTSRLMVNHSNEYKPPKEGDPAHQWKDSLEEPQAQRN